MISTATPPSPDFDESLQLLLQLHELTLEDRDESDESDAIRDAMDAPWYRLTESEAALLRGLSADLYSIGTDRIVADSVPELDVAQMRAAVASENWANVLDILRKNEEQLPPAGVAFLRGTCWANLGKPNVAIEFLRESLRLEPLHPMMEIWLLACMVQAGRAIDVVERAMQITQESENPLLLLSAAIVLSVRAGETDDASEGKALRQNAIRAGSRGLQRIDMVNPKEKETVEAMLIGSWLHLALNYDELGDSGKAREACATALMLDSNNVDALMLQDSLNREADPDSVAPDFRKGSGQRLPIQPGFGLPANTFHVLGNQE